MPHQTPDASAFTRMRKFNAIQQRNVNDVKYLTHLYQYVPRTSGLPDFLINPNAYTTVYTYNKLGMTPPAKTFFYTRQKYIR